MPLTELLTNHAGTAPPPSPPPEGGDLRRLTAAVERLAGAVEAHAAATNEATEELQHGIQHLCDLTDAVDGLAASSRGTEES